MLIKLFPGNHGQWASEAGPMLDSTMLMVIIISRYFHRLCYAVSLEIEILNNN